VLFGEVGLFGYFLRVRAHKKAGAKSCKKAGVFKTNNIGGLDRFNRDLNKYVNDPNNTWDCTVFVQSKDRNGKMILAHMEHVTAVSLTPGTGRFKNASISTLNGLDQGNQSTTVPSAPGTNTWTSTPGGTNPLRLSGSTHAQAANYLRSIAPVQKVSYVCCK